MENQEHYLLLLIPTSLPHLLTIFNFNFSFFLFKSPNIIFFMNIFFSDFFLKTRVQNRVIEYLWNPWNIDLEVWVRINKIWTLKIPHESTFLMLVWKRISWKLLTNFISISILLLWSMLKIIHSISKCYNLFCDKVKKCV